MPRHVVRPPSPPTRLSLALWLASAGLLGACSVAPSVSPLSPSSSAHGGGVAQPSQQSAAASACPALAQQALPGVRITEATLVAAGSQQALEAGSNRPVGEPLPEHCLVRGRIDERVGADGQPYHTGFELRLPSAFSGRFVYQGGGGNDGVVFNAVGRNTGATGWADNALLRGFAAVSTDAGHQSPAPTFGLDPQARTEHAWRAHERTARTARALVAAYYGRPADRHYFVGCSGGGRQGMMFTQRFPELFDGVIAVAPAMRVSEGATIAAAWTVQQFLAVAPYDGQGRPVLSQALSPAQLQRVAQAVTERCDANDGLKDGLVQDALACRLDARALLCPVDGEASNGCLQPAQAQALNQVMGGPRSSQGPLYFGWPWDPGIADAGWRNWTLGTATQGAPNARHITLMAGALGHEFVTPPDPALSTTNFNFDRDPARMQAFHAVYDTADDVQLAGFRQRGGKLMFFHGMADPIFSARELVDYQQRLNNTHGAAATAQWARSFLVPGMGHCAGGPATDRFDGLSALVRWVEQGQAPDQVLASGSGTLPTSLGRPLCPWPQQARYTGGDAQSATSFSCR
ncbi:MAG: tannase/feruloyl esterase family alpha/beta hydrolase [Burkholderiales bacterium PBB5]|nr:MAG: tannase/feruloyl esterase family alpha/beta hydrolase [Burkholderiales bacterium PBB5]